MVLRRPDPARVGPLEAAELPDPEPGRGELVLEGAAWVGGALDPPPEPLDAAVTFAPVGTVVAAALAALDRGATVAVNAIHLDRIPEMPYQRLWLERTLRSVAN